MGGKFANLVWCKNAEDLALAINEGIGKVEEHANLIDVKLFKDKRFYALLILEEKA